MTVVLTRHGQSGEVTVTVHGVVDINSVGELARAIAAALEEAPSGGLVRVDLAAVRLLDSSGINALLQGRRAADAAGRRFGVVGATGVVLEVLQITGVADHLTAPA